MYRKLYFLYVFTLGVMSCGTRDPSPDKTPQDLVGVWDLMNEQNKCIERYVFNADGTFSFYDNDGQSNGAYNLKEGKKLGLFHTGRKASYLPFELVGDGRLVVFKSAANNYYVRVPKDYETRVQCPSKEVLPPMPPTIPTTDPCTNNKCPPVCPPAPQPCPTPCPPCPPDKPCPPCPKPEPTPVPPPTPKPEPLPPVPQPAPKKCSCSCECTIGNVTEFKSIPFKEYELLCHRPKPIPVPPPAPTPCPPEKPCPAPQPQLPQSCKCTCNSECN
jgi:hypothetical protein